MADSSEIQSKIDAELQQSKRDQQDSSFLETLVPIPDFFFNIKAEIEPIGGSKWRIRIFGYILYFITLCVMFGSFAYYSLPEQRVSLESIVTSEWQKPGFACKALQKTTLHGLSTDWSFDECVKNVNVPDATNVKSVTKHANYVHYDYDFASDGDSNKGVISLYDDRYASSVLQKTNQAANDWKRDGYSCYPEPPYDNTYNLNYNVSECPAAVLPPSLDTVSLESFYDISAYPNPDRARYNPFGTANGIGYPTQVTDVVSSTNTRLDASGTFPTCDMYKKLYGDFYFKSMELTEMFVYKMDCTSNGVGSYSSTMKSITVSEGIEAWEKLLSTPADQYGNFGADAICSKFKRNGNGFRCFDKPKPPTTKELAIQRYATEYPPETICAPLKLNSPFQCARNVEVPATTRLSLSVAAAQAVFALTGIALVALLRKLQKPSTTTSESLSTDGDLRSMMRKLRNEFHSTVDQLRNGQDQLRVEFRTGQDQLRAGQGTHEELIQKLLSKEGGR
ncbi:predicted protein [Micromonas commoda]|uniref:Uncharacterized protein n=1 Tax=Micromonas commoda (strain RCC299 / NOUM17 / CCMP2709) TaxID=296587 RepID=C1EJJ3_MICCC|nr:predicted protein [Micromonas commoda]ACO68194.1 predicted protein [Micromonas commoda]|eukprot:XP_002506936.1 predicted protein [Micromonas commoda]